MLNFHPDATQLVGLAAFAGAALACARAAAAALGSPKWLWRGLAGAHVAMGIDVLLGLRYRVHDFADALLQMQGLYASRGEGQLGLLIAAACLAAGAVVAMTRSRGLDAWAIGAALATAVGVWLFVVETISLHGLDAVMYAPAGPIRVIGWCWAAVCVGVMVPAWRAVPRR